jgi:hypothetical protein
MPCSGPDGPRYGEGDLRAASLRLIKERDDATAAACEALEQLLGAQGWPRRYMVSTLSEKTQLWWREHQETDRLREHKELKAKAKQMMEGMTTEELKRFL